MRTCSYLAFAGITIVVVSCAAHPTASHASKRLTVEQIVSSPEAFDGSQVLVKGFLLQPMIGEIAIYQNEPDHHRGAPESHVLLDLDPNKRDLMPFQLKQCEVEGTFHASHGPGAPGRIGEITRLEVAQ